MGSKREVPPQGGTYLVRVRPEWDTKGSGETKVGELEVTVLVDEQVLRLEISMEDPVGVAVVQSLDQLQREALPEMQARETICGRSSVSNCLARLRMGRHPIKGRPTDLDERGPESLRASDGVHVLFEVHVEELHHKVQLGVRVDNVEKPDRANTRDSQQ
jgi:hypothetical protein